MRAILNASIIIFLVILCLACTQNEQPIKNKNSKLFPHDYFFRQRAFPQGEINMQAYRAAIEQSKSLQSQESIIVNEWENVGPINIGGRITSLSMHPSSEDVIYAGSASGGVFKSTDGGVNWLPIFDEALSLSIGDLAVAPSNADVIYVGTGESNGGGGSVTYDGFGIYKSNNGGISWEHLGLEEGRNTGRLVVHPNDENVVYTAMMGNLFGNNSDRGIYKTIDGGSTWEQMLFVSDSTGGADLAIHPLNPDTVYASTWERIRRPNRRSYGGATSRIYRSYDGGANWTELTSGLPSLPSQKGRIGIAIAPSQPETVYAIYADQEGSFEGIFRSNDNGDSWTALNGASIAGNYSSFGWWFGRLTVHPTNPDEVYAMGLDVKRSVNGGSAWSTIGASNHVDQHAYFIHPINTSLHISGNDGGIYTSQNAGASWFKVTTLPNIQFYACEIDEQNPIRYYGGAQDNGTLRTLTGNNDDWVNIFGGDGFNPMVNPIDNSKVYTEYQYGNFQRSTNGGSNFTFATSGISGGDRKNWNTPIVFDPNNPSTLYLGTNRLYRSTNNAVSWTVISNDLTDGPPTGNLPYGTLTTIAVSKSNDQVIYTGSDDGNVHVTFDNGLNWENISAGLPKRWITRLAVDPLNELHALVTLSGFRNNSYQSHVFETMDGGSSWFDIAGNLPEAPVNDIVMDTVLNQLIVGTDVGVFATDQTSIDWYNLAEGLPNVPITDLRLHYPTYSLIAASFGRSMFHLEMDATVGIETTETRIQDVKIYPNPAFEVVEAEFNLPKNIDGLEVAIISLNGQIVQQEHIGSFPAGVQGYRISIHEDIPPGYYLLQLNSNQDILFSKQLIIQ